MNESAAINTTLIITQSLSASPPTTPTKSMLSPFGGVPLASVGAANSPSSSSSLSLLRAGSFVKRRAETVQNGSDVKQLDETVAHNLVGLVMTRLFRGFDMGEENPEPC